MKVLWYNSHLVWLVFEGSIPTYACFCSENIFVTCSGCLLVVVFFLRNGKKEKTEVGGEAKEKMHGL